MTIIGFPVAIVLGLAGTLLLVVYSDLPQIVKSVAKLFKFKMQTQEVEAIVAATVDGSNSND